ncbi:amino acid/amide ABC transporter substrate-binding protein (HAAT family) [Roseovarius halotolerans]|uniref:Leucine-specific-binding protein n=1 Tax=Roseovarius halotolerans TaxID=505353 RepID=A0A1X6YHE5_9RHOB|nr:ABC transporter substrate-binding protein [Roseovarius halotolerans]RKT34601.1 amino acid/amide ABC transporter substrate-binding protein (HAAT family) [Roseovarius halotolerans]SLN21584.1 Leucine-specific-binding protein precursor [Roseovarius halotolerans]
MKRNTLLAAASTIALISGGAMAQETLKLGALVTLSGAGASWGQGMMRAAELAAEDVNEDGGLEVDGTKYKVEIIAYDDAYKANEAVTAANRLVFEDEVKYIIGTVGSAPILAIQPITEENGVITMTLGFTGQALSPEKPYTFRPNPTTAEVAQPQIDWIVKTQEVKTVGALFPKDETGEAIAKDLSAAYEKAGATLAATEFFERDRVDFIPLLTRIIAQGVDAIELDGNSPATAGQIVQQARDLGFEGVILRTGGPATQEIVNVAGEAATEGMFVHSAFDPGVESAKAYEERFTSTYNEPMNGFSPFFYDGTKMLFQAMRDAGTVEDTEAVKTALENISDYQGILGTMNWTGEDRYGIAHQLDSPFYIARVEGGEEVIVARCTSDGCE